MDLPNVSFVRRNAANPTYDIVRIVESDAADPAAFQRFDDLVPRRSHVGPRLASVQECAVEQRCRLVNPIAAVGGEINDAKRRRHASPFGSSPAGAIACSPPVYWR